MLSDSMEHHGGKDEVGKLTSFNLHCGHYTNFLLRLIVVVLQRCTCVCDRTNEFVTFPIRQLRTISPMSRK